MRMGMTTSKIRTAVVSTRKVEKMSRTLTRRYTEREMTLFSAVQEIEAIPDTIPDTIPAGRDQEEVAMAVVMDVLSTEQAVVCAETSEAGTANSVTQPTGVTADTVGSQTPTAEHRPLDTWITQEVSVAGGNPKRRPSNDLGVRSNL